MGELIDRDWVLKRMVFAPDADTVRMAPAVDAEPVRPAVWLRKDKDQALFGVEWECTNCHDTIALNGLMTPIGNGFRFCPNCGAKMKGCEQG